MRDIITDALVLDKEETGDFDARLMLFTEKMGRVAARARSIRKITSKLAGHLEPFSFGKIRLVEGKGTENGWSRLQVVDALKTTSFPHTRDIVPLILETTLEGHPDPRLWQAVQSGGGVREILDALGFDPEFAHCARCGKENPNAFFLPESAYYCRECLPRDLHPSQFVVFPRV